MTNFRTFTCILGFVLFGALFIDSKCVHRHRHRKCWVECAADVKCKCHSVADKTTTDTTKTTTEPEQMTNRLSFRAVKAEMPREERLEQRLAMIPKKTAGDAPPPVQTPEELAKERELVTQMLEEYRAKRRPEVEALIKKQANDPNHQARLNAIKKAMLKHPEEARRLEKENGKSIPELNANRTDVYQVCLCKLMYSKVYL